MSGKINVQLVHLHRKMQNIQRLAGTFKHKSYNLAEHSFYVLQLFQMICEAEGVPYTAKDLILASRHDLVEAITGDLLYPVKNLSSITKECWSKIEKEVVKKYPVLEDYSDESLENEFSHPDLYRFMKAADILDLWLFCKEEEKMGNTTGNLGKVIVECENLLLYSYKTKVLQEFMNEYQFH